MVHERSLKPVKSLFVSAISSDIIFICACVSHSINSPTWLNGISASAAAAAAAADNPGVEEVGGGGGM